jgi:hypothetical protein
MQSHMYGRIARGQRPIHADAVSADNAKIADDANDVDPRPWRSIVPRRDTPDSTAY